MRISMWIWYWESIVVTILLSIMTTSSRSMLDFELATTGLGMSMVGLFCFAFSFLARHFKLPFRIQSRIGGVILSLSSIVFLIVAAVKQYWPLIFIIATVLIVGQIKCPGGAEAPLGYTLWWERSKKKLEEIE